MKHQEFYRKYKTAYPPTINRWNIIWAIMVTALIEPFLVLQKTKGASFSGQYYLQQVGYFLLIAFPFVLILFWIYWRESAKRKRAFCWVGKFKVLHKRQSLLRCYLILSPGDSHELIVNRSLFKRVSAGDYVIIRRDSLGDLDEIRFVSSILGRMRRSA